MQLKAAHCAVHVMGVNETHNHPRHRAVESGDDHLPLMNGHLDSPSSQQKEWPDLLGLARG